MVEDGAQGEQGRQGERPPTVRRDARGIVSIEAADSRWWIYRRGGATAAQLHEWRREILRDGGVPDDRAPPYPARLVGYGDLPPDLLRGSPGADEGDGHPIISPAALARVLGVA